MPKIFACIPILDELENIDSLFNCLNKQTHKAEKIICCVNQPKDFILDKGKNVIYQNNQKTIQLLQQYDNVIVIDRSSNEFAWTKKKQGVGSARNLCFEKACDIAADNDIIFSLDADTLYSDDYFEKTAKLLSENPSFSAASLAYYHPLNGDEQIDKALLHYEIYMRYYLLNLMSINSPYAFTALGSAIAFSAKNYKKINGISQKLAGEDFYLLQKFRKQAPLLLYSDSIVKPSSRVSTRVPFGTGPAIKEKEKCDFNKYPLYSELSFNKINTFYNKLYALYLADTNTPIDDFLVDTFGDKSFIDLIRKNNPDKDKFVKGIHQKFDGLKVLQCLRFYNNTDTNYKPFENLELLIKKHSPNNTLLDDFTTFASGNISVKKLSEIRDLLFDIEIKERTKYQLVLLNKI